MPCLRFHRLSTCSHIAFPSVGSHSVIQFMFKEILLWYNREADHIGHLPWSSSGHTPDEDLESGRRWE